jgi:hypothetical protein
MRSSMRADCMDRYFSLSKPSFMFCPPVLRSAMQQHIYYSTFSLGVQAKKEFSEKFFSENEKSTPAVPMRRSAW